MWLKLIGLVQRWLPPDTVLRSSNEPGELLRWQCLDVSAVDNDIFLSFYCYHKYWFCLFWHNVTYLLTEMAERHDAKAVLRIACGLVHRLQDLIDNK